MSHSLWIHTGGYLCCCGCHHPDTAPGKGSLLLVWCSPHSFRSGHFAWSCKLTPSCGLCVGEHLMKQCRWRTSHWSMRSLKMCHVHWTPCGHRHWIPSMESCLEQPLVLNYHHGPLLLNVRLTCYEHPQVMLDTPTEHLVLPSPMSYNCVIPPVVGFVWGWHESTPTSVVGGLSSLYPRWLILKLTSFVLWSLCHCCLLFYWLP